MNANDRADMAEAVRLRKERRAELAERVRRYAKQNPEIGDKPLARLFKIDRQTAKKFIEEGK